MLRFRKQQLSLAGPIAERLGWLEFDESYGPGMQAICWNPHEIIPQAIAGGCMVNELIVKTFGLETCLVVG